MTQLPPVGRVPPVVIQDGIEFVSTAEALRRSGMSPTGLANRVRNRQIHVHKLSSITATVAGGRRPNYFRADEIRKYTRE